MTPATPESATGSLPEALSEFIKANSGRGLDAVALRIVDAGGGPVITGQVLTRRQGTDVERLARSHGAQLDIRVVADPHAGLEDGWCDIAVDVLDLWRVPERAGEEMGRQTQYMAADGPLRRLGRVGQWVLVQGPDLAMGWAAAADLRDAAPRSGNPWAEISRAVEGEACGPAGGQDGATAEALVQRARAELEVAYVWGGTTHAGFDCSGLMLRMFHDVTGVLLPRHTGDQRRVGRRVVAGEVATGDLLFATPRGQKIGHVLLVTSAHAVLHACRTEQRVIEESFEDNAARYQPQGWRRPVSLSR
ncbi:MAG: C40 family peptidase [Candidatus Dormibacteria bacterium]